MLSKKLMLALLLAPLTVVPDTAWAQDEEEEEEEDRPSKRRSSEDDEEEEAARPEESAAKIREIARGVYTKAGVGGAIYPISQVISAGTFVGISVGQDFVDRETQSMAWEIAFQQGLHNGVDILTQAQNGCTVNGGSLPCTQGDLRTYSLAVNYEISFYPARRWGIGARVGGGAMYSPLFIYPEYYQTDIVPDVGADPGIHNSIHPFVMGGPTLEYYTKLSHFSVGIDADVFYAFNWDLGINASLALKYTF